MTIVSKLAVAAVLAVAAGSPALAQGVYVGVGPAYGWYDDGYAYPGAYAYAYPRGPYYSGAYAYAGEPYYGRRWYQGNRLYRCIGPATSDCYHGSRQLQGTR